MPTSLSHNMGGNRGKYRALHTSAALSRNLHSPRIDCSRKKRRMSNYLPGHIGYRNPILRLFFRFFALETSNSRHRKTFDVVRPSSLKLSPNLIGRLHKERKVTVRQNHLSIRCQYYTDILTLSNSPCCPSARDLV